MFPFQIRPDHALNEIQEFGNRLVDGVKVLSELGDIDVGSSDRTAVYREDKMTLYRFTPLKDELHPVPVLINYALVNRPYMADLQEDRSLVRGLLEQGLDVYLIDWGYPDAGDRYLNLDDYINGYIDRCVDIICEESGQEKINILGICQGGAFSICYSALHPDKVKNLITTVTPVDFHTPDDLLSHWVRSIDVDLLVDTMGNIPGELLNLTFLSLMPFRLSGQKYLDMVNALEDPRSAKNFMRMEKWIFDSPDQAGEAYREFIKQFYQQNGLVNGTVRIGQQKVDLSQLSMPVLNIFAAADHLVPPAASKALGELVGSDDYTELEFPGGHIGVFVSGKSMKMIPPSVREWLESR